MDLALHLHPAAASAAVIIGVILEATCRGSLARRQPATPNKKLGNVVGWALGAGLTAVSALVIAEVFARLGIGSWTGGAIGGLALSAGLYAAPRLAEGGWRAPHDIALLACRVVQFGMIGAVIGGLS